jgi:hypothetical protein
MAKTARKASCHKSQDKRLTTPAVLSQFVEYERYRFSIALETDWPGLMRTSGAIKATPRPTNTTAARFTKADLWL